MTLIEIIEKFIAQEISKGDAIFFTTEKTDFYSLGLDNDGSPYSFGNADDVYSDGFNNGELSGSYEFAKKLETVISLYKKTNQ